MRLNNVNFGQQNLPLPGVVLEKQGDFLLLDVAVESDSRDYDTRVEEIDQTIRRMLSAAASDNSIELSFVDTNSIVRPLTLENYRSGLQGGSRPDTTLARVKVKTAIPQNVSEPYRLYTKLSDFTDNIEGEGRAQILSQGNVSVSIIDPYKYRGELLRKITGEMRDVTSSLGPDYRVMVEGLDAEMSWVRSGDLNLAFYIRYTYDIIPTSITVGSITFPEY